MKRFKPDNFWELLNSTFAGRRTHVGVRDHLIALDYELHRQRKLSERESIECVRKRWGPRIGIETVRRARRLKWREARFMILMGAERFGERETVEAFDRYLDILTKRLRRRDQVHVKFRPGDRRFAESRWK